MKRAPCEERQRTSRSSSTSCAGFAQPLGIELPNWEGRVIETKKGVVRLLPLAEHAKQLFGENGAQAVAARLGRRRR